MTVAGANDDETRGALAWAGMAVLCGCAVLSGLLEVLFVPLFIGSVNIPLVVLAALIGNLVLPRWGYRLVATTSGAVLPVVFWLVSVLALSLFPRPEGDVLVAAQFREQYVFYGVLLVGAIAGFATIIVITGPASRPGGPPRPAPSGRPPGRPNPRPRVSR